MKREDLVAGLCVAGLMLPEAVAYANIAGMPPQRAVLAAIAGCFCYALVGRSRFAIVAPTSSSAAILAATLGASSIPLADRGAVAALVVLLVGALFLVAAAARLGGLTSLISRPVLRGFAFGIAVTIIVHQLPILVGVAVPGGDIGSILGQLISAAPRWNAASLVVGGAALAALLMSRRYPAWPGAFGILALGIAAAELFDLPARHVALVGLISTALTWPSLPHLPPGAYSQLAQFALPLVLILFAESWGTIRTLALRHGDTVDANRELGALGAANIASAFVQGMPVGAGFSAGSASEAAGAATRQLRGVGTVVLALPFDGPEQAAAILDGAAIGAYAFEGYRSRPDARSAAPTASEAAGAATRATAATAAAGLAALVLFAAPLIARLPQTVLAAVVIAALTHALDPRPLLRLWRLGRDQYVAIGAALGVLALGVLDGMLLAIVLSLAALIQRFATPGIARLGRVGSSHDYVDVARHPDAVAPTDVAIWRPATPLFFANAERILALIATKTRAEPGLSAIVLSLEESNDLDSTALDALIEFDRTMEESGIPVQLARLHDHVRDLLAAAGMGDLAASGTYSVDDAVTAAESRRPIREVKA